MAACACAEIHPPKRTVLTGGPGAGKTAVLELMRKTLCEHVRVVPRRPASCSAAASRAAMRSTFGAPRNARSSTCSASSRRRSSRRTRRSRSATRGTLDGFAYWPGPDELWSAAGTTHDEQLARYDAVIHLQTPALEGGYNRRNPLRIESAAEAAAIDARITYGWARHPRRFEVPPMADFLAKAARAVELVRGELPECCRRHPVAELGEAGATEVSCTPR
jgi:hypothetical protein